MVLNGDWKSGIGGKGLEMLCNLGFFSQIEVSPHKWVSKMIYYDKSYYDKKTYTLIINILCFMFF